MMINTTLFRKLVSIGLFTALCGAQALAATSAPSTSELSIEDEPTSERRYLLDPIELTPMSGFSVVDSKAGFNVGAYGAYPLLDSAPLYAEPSFVMGFFSGRTMFNVGAGARYDIALAETKVRPFARAALGPTFQTSGSTVVFNASFGGGALIPVSERLELRAEAALINIDGNAGFQLMGGISL